VCGPCSIRASHAASVVANEIIAGLVVCSCGWRGMSSTDETARDLASRTWTTIHSERATEQATKTAATAAIRLGRR
jgi:hypothetical protein